jgi:NADH:ubiquinone oxidoreductase subunit E
MITTIEGSFIGGQLSRTGQLKNLQIQTAQQIQQVKVPKSLRPILAKVLTSSTYLQLQVKIGHRKLKAIKVLMVADRAGKISGSHPTPVAKIQVCSKGSCHKRGSKKLCTDMQAMIQSKGWQNSVVIEEVSCLKECKQAPNIRIKPSGAICHQASSRQVGQLLETILAGQKHDKALTIQQAS